MRQFFIDQGMVSEQTASITGAVHHHISRVLRLSPGTTIQLVCPGVSRFNGTITQITPDQTTVVISEVQSESNQQQVPIHLIQGLPKADHLDLILQKGTELGLDRITLVPTDSSVVKLSADRLPDRLIRWQKIGMEAARQSERLAPPAIDWGTTLETVFTQLPSEGLRLLLWERAEHPSPLREQLANLAPPCSVHLLVGPEGGFTPREYQQAVSAGFIPLSLGRRILRTETASLAITAILQYSWGDI